MLLTTGKLGASRNPLIIAKLLHGRSTDRLVVSTHKIHKGVFECLLSCIQKPDFSKDNELIVVGGCFVVVWPMTRRVLYIITRRLKEGLVELGLDRRQLICQMMMRH